VAHTVSVSLWLTQPEWNRGSHRWSLTVAHMTGLSPWLT